MKRILFLAFLTLLITSGTIAQVITDSIIPPPDTLVKAADTTVLQPVKDSFSIMPRDTSWKLSFTENKNTILLSREIMDHHPWFGFSAPATYPGADNERVAQGKDMLFYVLVFLFMVYALLKTAFPKYFNDLYRLFFRTTLKQRQISEQLIQTPLPSLLLNGFFVVSAGMYLCFLLGHYKLDPTGNFWLLFLYCTAGLSAVYLVKFVGLKISGWVFNMREATDSYIFIIFIINKMLGILVLPFLVLMAFTSGDVYSVSVTLSLLMVAGLLGYRFVLTYATIRNQVSVNPFHFFIYLLAFEIAPLLLIYKGLLVFFNKPA